MSRDQRDSLALTNIEMMLDKQLAGSKRLSAGTLMALRIRYDKLRPALSSIDQTLHNADDLLSQDQIEAKMLELIQAHPDLLQRLLAMQAKANPLGAEQQTVQTVPEAAETTRLTGTDPL